MAGNDPMILNHISVDINDVPVSHDPRLLLIEKLEPNSLELGSSMLSTSSEISSTSGSEIKAEAAVPIVPKSPIVHKWYFKTTSTTGDDEKKRSFDCCDDCQPPVRVDLSTRFTNWTFSTKNIESGLYDVTIGLTTTEVNVDLVEALTFRFAAVDGKSIAPSERIWKEDLKTMCGTAHNSAKWRLCLQMEQTKEYDTLMMVMEIRPSYGTHAEVDIGHLRLHFIELHTSENADYNQDSSILFHRPWVWSLDVHHGSKTAASKTIIHYDISGAKSHVATLSVSENDLILELWDISNTNDPSAAVSAGSNTDARLKHPSQQSTLCGMVQVPVTLLEGQNDLRESFSVSTSWDGSHVALFDARHLKKDQKGLFAIYRHDHSLRQLACDSEQSDRIRRFTDDDGLQVAFRGKFHVITTSDGEAHDEIFIACTENEVVIFGVSQVSRYFKTIRNCYISGQGPLLPSWDSPDYAFDAMNPLTFDRKYLTSFDDLQQAV